MRILFVHQNFPGQYKYLARALANMAGVEVAALGMNKMPAIEGVRTERYKVGRGNGKGVHPWAIEIESKILRGEAAARAAQRLKDDGFTPDVICAHPGWGEALFLKDVFPDAPLLCFFEYFYRADEADAGFDPEYTGLDFDQSCRLRVKNAHELLSLDAADWGVSPTRWQKSLYPAAYHAKISEIHDGIDTAKASPNPGIRVAFGEKQTILTRQDEIITFVSRNLEPYRGFHIFMRALPIILERRPHARVLVLGGDGASYGGKPKDGRSYREVLLAELGDRLDRSRVHFLGQVPYDQFIGALQLSAAHIYLTYPFVLSWSMLEAMSAGCAVIGSATPPVEEIIKDGHNGLLVDFFDPHAIAGAVDRVLDHSDRMQAMRDAARATILERYDLKRVCLPRHLALIETLAAGGLPDLTETQ